MSIGFESGDRRRINHDPSINWNGSGDRTAELIAFSYHDWPLHITSPFSQEHADGTINFASRATQPPCHRPIATNRSCPRLPKPASRLATLYSIPSSGSDFSSARFRSFASGWRIAGKRFNFFQKLAGGLKLSTPSLPSFC